MKRICAFMLLIALGFTWSMPTKAQIFKGPDSPRRAQKAARTQQKALDKSAKKQRKAMQKYEKAQRKKTHRHA